MRLTMRLLYLALGFVYALVFTGIGALTRQGVVGHAPGPQREDWLLWGLLLAVPALVVSLADEIREVVQTRDYQEMKALGAVRSFLLGPFVPDRLLPVVFRGVAWGLLIAGLNLALGFLQGAWYLQDVIRAWGLPG
jgi:hypothetical protein